MTINLIGTDRDVVLAAINAIEKAAKHPSKQNMDDAETLLSKAKTVLKQYAPPAPEPAPQSLLAKREERLFRETFDTLTPEQRAEFEKQHGYTATIRRLAAQAKAEADRLWEQRELQKQSERLDQSQQKQQQYALDSRTVTTDYDLIFELTGQLEARRLERLEARRARELAAEAWDEELARVQAGMDREELEIFIRLTNNLPTAYESLMQFHQSKQSNPLADVNETTDLYQMDLERKQGNTRVTLPTDISKVNDSNELYNIAFNQAMEG